MSAGDRGPAEAGGPAEALFAQVVGQGDALAQLRAACRQPVHAYLLVGPAHLGFRSLARGFAAAMLCPVGGCGSCEVCRRALGGVHPDLVEVERAGANLSVEDARRVVQLAQRRPMEARRQVIVVSDLHLARLSAPVLLKTLEEPPGPTVFVLQADSVPAELATIASRCVVIRMSPVAPAELARWLESLGASPEQAGTLAEAAGGSPERARLLMEDEGVDHRRQLWAGVPTRLDGTGAAAGTLAGELLAVTEAALAPLRARHQAELEDLEQRAQGAGERGVPGRREVDERHRREERRWRADELRLGLGLLAGAYRDRLTEQLSKDGGVANPAGAARERGLEAAVQAVAELSRELIRNPNEALQLEALLVKLSAVPAA